MNMVNQRILLLHARRKQAFYDRSQKRVYIWQEGDKKLQRAKNTTVVAKKRLVRYNEGAQMYSIGRNKFQQLAKDAHAILKIGRIVLVDLDIFDKYLETFRVER